MKIRNLKSIKELRRTWNFCKSMGITQVMDVPIRKKGMTGSGKEGKCHSNTMLLATNYGGSVVLGYCVSFEDDFIRFYTHSVWKTPEGNVVDVTYHQQDEDTISFAPLVEYTPRTGIYRPQPDILFTREGKVYVLSEDEEEVTHIPNRRLKTGRKTMRDAFIPFTPFIEKYDGEWEEFIAPLHDGGFTKPSLVTGKYFELRDAA